MTQTCTTTQTWIKWDGGECPVDKDDTIMVQYKYGMDGPYLARSFRWSEGSALDSRQLVIAYTTDIPVVEFVDDEPIRGAGCEEVILP